MDTDISMIVDMSGSMASLTSDTIGGFNSWLEESAKGQEQGDEVRVTVTTFDTLVEQHVKNIAIKEVPLLGTKENPYRPRGGTALLDAVGETLTAAHKRVPKGKRGLAFIITDGQENSSHKWDHAKLGKLMSKLEKSDRWTFVYLGAGVDAWAQARSYSPNASIGQTVSAERYDLVNLYRAAGQYTGQTFLSRSGGVGARAENAALPISNFLEELKEGLNDVKTEIKKG